MEADVQLKETLVTAQQCVHLSGTILLFGRDQKILHSVPIIAQDRDYRLRALTLKVAHLAAGWRDGNGRV